MLAIMPNNSSIMPPRTDSGMDLRKPLSLPMKANKIAVTAEILKTAGLVTLVREIAPVTSE